MSVCWSISQCAAYTACQCVSVVCWCIGVKHQSIRASEHLCASVALACLHVSGLVDWCVGVSVHRCVGGLVCWFKSWSVGSLVCWSVSVSVLSIGACALVCWCVSVCQCVGVLACLCIGASMCQWIGVLI
jgi:hypothetical protein